jgi:transcriptional regulator with XRE-family HTH domain
MDRRQTVAAFRGRLGEVIARSGLSRMAFAARAGLDRSTLSQLLSPGHERLPRAETIAAIAAREQVSVDWLLGLSQEGQIGTDVIPQALEFEPGAGSPADARLARWQDEAVGYKIRYVPATLPDLLRTEEVIRYEYKEYGAATPKARIEQAEERLAYSRLPETDMEVCSSRQGIEDFARGYGIWSGLPVASRAAQLNAIIFGPKRAAVYVGNMYLVFNSTEHIQVLTRHFDDLIRAAVVQPPDVIEVLEGLLRELDPGGTQAARTKEDSDAR